VAPWVAFEMSIAILPVLVIPFWIPIFARQEEPVSSRARRLTLASAVVGLFTVTVLVGVLLYVA
jgi:hypothetical protein